ncbi:MAG: hypothetical protein ACD_46C00589G0003 [uncultured bacterium]|nr:MAG: hypothetical protein ACD_46C00589G0003 [uncultured bacterium]OGT33806.1 MAG: hypothetical protein A3C44_05255 [Gammaproteobacteria bacterium RIFCSPHIGHO2_02_FULL_39_13]OGT50629.1 MAG: hypothetical protein A3E53_02840 [Gammaproteobacteria bacterium RIFCSPHIGHO2_12_FULL_39_24]
MRSWCLRKRGKITPAIHDAPKRWKYTGAIPADFCQLTKTYTSEHVEYLLDQAEKIEDIFFIQINISMSNGTIVPELISLYPIEIENIREDMIYGSCTAIIIDSTKKAVLVDLNSLFIKKHKASKLLCGYYSIRNKLNTKQSEKAPYHNDAISDAVINYILPEILSDKNSDLSNPEKFDCFLMLKSVLPKIGARKINLIKAKNKDESTISFTDKHEEQVNTNFKAFRGRISNLVAEYKEK